MASGAKQLLGGLVAAVALALFAAPAALAFTAHGSVGQVWALGAHPGERLALLDARGRVVSVRAAGPLGGLVFRGLAPGAGYRVRDLGSGAPPTPTLTVLPDRSAPPSTSIYRQRLVRSGYGYLTVRDGIKLAIDVRLPSGPGPYPTVVEYSGYGYADPAGPQSGIA
ncbi:MAG: hypothetical protein JO027_08495, partial [Solirubrobacterales bacterium]|nr:hypothetical protein [Solirubrobacterales bacterium]